MVRHKLRCVLHRKFGRFFFLRKPFRFFVFLSQNLQIFCLALRKRAQYVVVVDYCASTIYTIYTIWKHKRSHQTSLCTNKCHIFLIITTKCYAQFMLNCKWACPPTFHHWTFVDQRKQNFNQIWNVTTKMEVECKWKLSVNGTPVLNA